MRYLSVAVLAIIPLTAACAAELPLVVQHLSGAAVRADEPVQTVTWGVPLPRGAVTAADQLRLLGADGKALACQFDPMATWDQGKSLKWVLLSFMLDPKQASGLKLVYGATPAAGRPTTTDEVGPRVGLWYVRQSPEGYSVSTGALRCTVSKTTGMLADVQLTTPGGDRPCMGAAELYLVAAGGNYEGRFVAGPAEITVTRQGSRLATLRCEGWYQQSDKKLCKYVNRFTFQAGSPVIKISQTFLLTEQSGQVAFADIGLKLPLVGQWAGQFGVDGQALPATGASYVRQDAPEHCVLVDANRQQEGKRVDGWMAQAGNDATVAVALRDAWQNYPLELALSPNDMTLHFWPEHGRTDNLHPVTLENINKLWFCHEGKLLDFAVPAAVYSFMGKGVENDYRYVRSAQKANAIGLAKTHEFSLMLAAGGDATAHARALARQVDDPIVVSLSGKDMCATGAFDDLYPAGDPQFAGIDRGMRDFFLAERRMEEACESFGKFNWGDGHTSWRWDEMRFDTIYRTWRNTHHGAPRVPWVLWARSADPAFLQYGLRNARHVLDLDYCHYSTPELEKLEYPVGKIAGALNDYKGLVHWHSGNRLYDYNSMTDFALWYTFVSGDDWGLEVAKRWGDAAVARFGAANGHREGAGVCDALLTLYQATWDERYLKLVHAYANKLIDQQLPDGRMPQWENYAPWLERYVRLVGPQGEAPNPEQHARARQSLIRWADAYLVGPADASGEPGHGWAYYNIMAAAYNETKNEKYLSEGMGNLQAVIDNAYEEPGQVWAGYWSGGSLWGYLQQRVPYFLTALARHGKPVEPAYPEFSVSQCTFHLYSGPERTMRVQLLGEAKAAGKAVLCGPDGKPVKEWELVKGLFAVRDETPVQPETKYTLKIEPDTIMVRAPVSNLPSEVMEPGPNGLNAMRGSRLYFMVPPGCAEFTIQVTGRLWPQTLTLYDPEDRLVERRQWSEFDGPKPQTLTVKPTAAQQGKLWCVAQGLAKNMVFTFDPAIPPYLAGPDPKRFRADW
jgi:hypothetical protein